VRIGKLYAAETPPAGFFRPRERPVTRARAGANEAMPLDMRSQITTLLAGMILSLQQEAIP